MSLRSLAPLVAAAALAAGCGGDDSERPGEESARDFEIAEVVERPPVPGERVGLVGQATVVEDLGFVLHDGDDAIFVIGPGAGGVETGDRVRVVGEVERLQQELATRIANELADDEDRPLPEVERVPLARVRTNQGAPYIALERVEPAP